MSWLIFGSPSGSRPLLPPSWILQRNPPVRKKVTYFLSLSSFVTPVDKEGKSSFFWVGWGRGTWIRRIPELVDNVTGKFNLIKSRQQIVLLLTKLFNVLLRKRELNFAPTIAGHRCGCMSAKQMGGYSGGCTCLSSAWSWLVGQKSRPPLALGPTGLG